MLLVDFWLVTEVTDKVTSYPGASVLSLFFILIGVYGQVEAYCLQLCVHGDTTLEVAFVAYFFFLIIWVFLQKVVPNKGKMGSS